MRVSTWTFTGFHRSRAWATHALASVLLAVCLGCGGGGAAPTEPTPVPPGATVLGRFVATLSGAAVTSVVDPAARAIALLELGSDGTAFFALTGDPGWVAGVTGVHVHAAPPGVDGALVVDVLSGLFAVDALAHTVEATLTIDPALAAQVAASPTAFYVDVHTAAAPAGLARGPLAPFGGVEWHALLDGAQETPPNATGSSGAAALRVGADRMLSWVLATASPAVASLTDAHVHAGGLGVAGPIVVALPPSSAVLDPVANTVVGSTLLSPATITRLAFDPAAFYVNLHTAAFPLGIQRGQLSTASRQAWAHLRGDLEPSVVSPSARGAVGLSLLSQTAGRVMLAVPAAQSLGTITSAKVHIGPPGVAGPHVMDLMASPDFAGSESTGSAEGAVLYDQVTYARLLAQPAALYAELLSTSAPTGLARGQFTRAPQTLVAQLSGSNEVPPVVGTNAGKLKVILTGLFTCDQSLTMTQPPVGDVLSAHVHDGPAGTNGPILIDLDVASGTVSGSTVSASSTFTGRTFVRLLANAAAFYGNAHTAALPNGAARGQLFLLTSDSPPAGLVYTTPVTYVTGTPISDNLPDSVGGAISSYSVAPALPAGLSLHATTGIISGTPTAITPQAAYVVTASNASGTASFAVSITVDEGPPLTLSYATPVIYVVGTAITSNAPTSTGGTITSYSVSPALPAGLSLNTTTGVLSGTPTASASAADYVVTGSNGAGFVDATINLRVDASLQAPSALSYATPVSYTTGTAITANSPTISGGPVDSWSISPALPAGLSLSTSTGVISGTPTTVTSAANYVVTATNAAGSTQATVNVAVTLGAPTNLSYDNNPALGYVIGGTFPTMTPTSQGGTVASYAISPALPAGVVLNTTTGVISGSPTATSAQTNYTVTATNATGNTTAQVTITVLQ